MKIQKLLTEHAWVAPWDLELNKTTIDQKGKIDSIYPELKGEGQCPFWKTLKSKIHGNDGEGAKVPKSFAIEVGKEYKIPLDPSYSTPCCICNGKSCTFFGGVAGGKISCNFKVGAKPIKKSAAPQAETLAGPKESSVHPTLRDSQVPAVNYNNTEKR